MLFRRNPLENHLLDDIENDDIDKFQTIVDSVFNINHKFSIFSTRLDEFLRFSPSLIAVAAYYKAIRIFRYLLVNGADLTVRDKRNLSVAHYAVCGGDFEILHLLDEYRVPFDGTLFTAVERGSEDIFKWILFYQSEDIHQRKQDGTTLLDASSRSGNRELTYYIFDLIKDSLSISEVIRLQYYIQHSNFFNDDGSENSDYDYEYDHNENDNNQTFDYHKILENDQFYSESENEDDRNDQNYEENEESTQNQSDDDTDDTHSKSESDDESEKSNEESENESSDSENDEETESQSEVSGNNDKNGSESEVKTAESDESESEAESNDDEEEERSEEEESTGSQSEKEESERGSCSESDSEAEKGE